MVDEHQVRRPNRHHLDDLLVDEFSTPPGRDRRHTGVFGGRESDSLQGGAHAQSPDETTADQSLPYKVDSDRRHHHLPTVRSAPNLVRVRPTGVPGPWPEGGCLHASMAPLADHAGHGQAAICTTADGLRGSLDLEQLEPMAPYVAWTAYFEQPGRYSLAADLQFQVRGFHQPCTLADLDGPDPVRTVQAIGDTIAGPYVWSEGIMTVVAQK
jgi:hypothetical protein